MSQNPPPLFLSEQEFLSLAFDVYSYWEKYGYFGRDCKVYDKEHLPPADEYLDFCAKTVKFIDNLPDFISLINVQSHAPYAQVFSETSIVQLLLFSMAWEYYEQFKCPMPKANPVCLSYFSDSHKGHLEELALRLNLLMRNDRGRLIAATGFLFEGKLYNPNSSRKDLDLVYGTLVYSAVDGDEIGCWGHLFPALIVEDICVKLYQPDIPLE